MTFGSICTGIGGLDLGLERAGMEARWMCEIDPFCRGVLAKRWPNVHCYEDMTMLEGMDELVAVDLLCGGFPCQPHSVEGEQKGSEDERNLWPATFGIVRRLRPRWCVFENVYGIINTIFGQVCSDLEREGYTVRPLVFGARDIGARHGRRRVWFMAHSQSVGQWRGPAKAKRRNAAASSRDEQLAGLLQPCPWPSVSSARTYGTRYGFRGRPHGMRRVKALGNAVVPHCAELIGRAIMAADQQFYCRESSNEGIHANR